MLEERVGLSLRKVGGKEVKILMDYVYCWMCCRFVIVEDIYYEFEFDVEEVVELYVLLMRYMVKTYKGWIISYWYWFVCLGNWIRNLYWRYL